MWNDISSAPVDNLRIAIFIFNIVIGPHIFRPLRWMRIRKLDL